MNVNIDSPKTKKAIEKKAKKEAAKHAQLQQLLMETPITKLMLDTFAATSHHDIMIGNLLKAIRQRIDTHKDALLHGRTPEHFRIDFTPSASGVTSIAGRLSVALSKKTSAAEVEKLLCLFVAWNRQAFPDVTEKHMVVRIKAWKYEEKNFRSQWLFDQKTYDAVEPVTWYKRKETVVAVFEAVRRRCERVDPESLLLRDISTESDHDGIGAAKLKKVQEWSLAKRAERPGGFAAKLMACFNGPERTSKQYEDLVERSLYSFMLANKTAVYGSNKDGISS